MTFSRFTHPGLVLSALIAMAYALAAPTAFAQCQYEVTAIIESHPCPPFGNTPPLIGSGMNNWGEVVGSRKHCSTSNDVPFYWSQKTGLITLPLPDGATCGFAYDINDHGQIVGELSFPGQGFWGFVYDMNTGVYTYLPPQHDGGGALMRFAGHLSLAVARSGSQLAPAMGEAAMPHHAGRSCVIDHMCRIVPGKPGLSEAIRSSGPC